uniref:BHLH domain-containing protein n=1 Tax=Caenorhabditis tropicalis TaxID=1561998 RepID=A0A1I7U555_9PELO
MVKTARKNTKELRNQREKIRQQNNKTAFEVLQNKIPGLTQRQRKNLPKIKCLHLAINYVKYLEKVLREPENPRWLKEYMVNTQRIILAKNSNKVECSPFNMEEIQPKAKSQQRRSSRNHGNKKYCTST